MSQKHQLVLKCVMKKIQLRGFCKFLVHFVERYNCVSRARIIMFPCQHTFWKKTRSQKLVCHELKAQMNVTVLTLMEMYWSGTFAWTARNANWKFCICFILNVSKF